MDSAKAETSADAAARRRHTTSRRRSCDSGSPKHMHTRTAHAGTLTPTDIESQSKGPANVIPNPSPTDDRQVRWSALEPQVPKPLIDQSKSGQSSPGSAWTPSYTKVYRGSFAATPISRSRLASGQATPRGGSLVASIPLDQFMSRLQLEADDLEDYGVEELRDGFFDASFYKMPRKELATAKQKRKIRSPFSLQKFVQLQKDGIKRFIWSIKHPKRRSALMRAVTGYMLAYVLCLVPAVRKWLGPYHFIMIIATIVNHAGRSIGSQIEGTITTIIGAGIGIGAGLLALWISTVSGPARDSYGAFLAVCLLITLPMLAWARARFARVFQLCICAGFALFFMVCERVGPTPSYRKAWEFGIPWVLGVAIAQITNILLLPNPGNVQIARALHKALDAAIGGLELPRPSTARQREKMSKETVEMSIAVRDFRSEITLSKISPEDMTDLRNNLQAVIRDFLRLECIAPVFEPPKEEQQPRRGKPLKETKIHIGVDSGDESEDDEKVEIDRIRAALAGPSREMINIMKEALEACDTLLMQILHQTSFLPPGRKKNTWDCEVLADRILGARDKLEEAHMVWAGVHPADASYTVIQIFLFTSTLLQASDQVTKLVRSTGSIFKKRRGANWRFYLPDYPLEKLVYRSNPQVRHDRGGTTTAFYFRTMKDIALLMSRIAGKAWVPDSDLTTKPSPQKQGEKKTLRFRIWEVLHELQGFEARFALKNTMTICLLAIPAWLTRSQSWWNEWEGWWCTVAAWHLMQPRVGGNLNDLAARLVTVALGAFWGALSFFAGNGNPYVMAVFALLFAIPFLYRYMLSSHPRSGFIGCLTFTVVSMTCKNYEGLIPPHRIAYTRGTAIIVGVLASVFINWFLWPFVARHELRKSLANMLINLSIVYRTVVAKYIYHDLDYMPSPQDIIDSQIREAKLREGFVRIRELLKMTEHEPRLRERFDPTPYEHLIDSSEKFFDHIIDVRQASLYFRISGDRDMAQMMLSCRRDAVATILMNLWVLGGGLRSKTPIPKYLPSAAIARRRLLQRIEDMDSEGYYEKSLYEGKRRRLRFTELEQLDPESLSVDGPDGKSGVKDGKVRQKGIDKWAHFYQYAYSSILNEIVRELEQLQIYTKAITGELSIGKFD
ncbi:hypothetical protein TWF569_002263 [Orbilia oligospora]|uniref:Uncharacterized protein n=1 Tax=Orbilia oligospora TaxID=2813651 RepID=A0A7C8J170_ORBOL|nr:hypothetical protein TWF706_002488 [Orbilia oligospora]KAF3080705.1 hypothetical protein TWF706_002488 [Orbilia oligospora]KAF3081649.1 hypothetical protein TWF102_001605 [Orbilia oligospora]KAF3112376.1 hypothetical protein TWF103_003163 [Orbilia oligospora]KAF3122185.1 hypothetical protein TWF569_002263 [Orbilia oligospora]